MVIDGPGGRTFFVTPDSIQQSLSGDNFSLMGHKVFKNFSFKGGEGKFFPPPFNLEMDEINLNVIKSKDRGGFFSLPVSLF
jgi:hypothetical protein